MSQADFFESEDSSNKTKTTRFCHQCWRDELHYDVIRSQMLRGFLMVTTLGLSAVIRPTRCVCCGAMRIF